MVKHRGDNICGVFLLDKPTGMSSNHALQRVKRLFNAKKAGHTGSLDPLATGLLPICFGKATCLSDYFLHSDKQYQAEVKFGITTDSHDSDGGVVASNIVDFTDDQLNDALNSFIGEIEQIPPMVSALKHKGQPLYKLALKGQEVERKPRKMTVYSLTGQRLEKDVAILDVHCSSGFYVRQLAADLGEMLACGAHLTALRRTASKKFTLDKSITLSQLTERFERCNDDDRPALIQSLLSPPEDFLYFLERINVDSMVAKDLCYGKRIAFNQLEVNQFDIKKHYTVYQGDVFLGIGEFEESSAFKIRRLFNSVLS